jgi:hypothetical protein
VGVEPADGLKSRGQWSVVSGQRATEISVEAAKRFDLFGRRRNLSVLGHKEGLFQFPDQNCEGPVQQHARSAGLAEAAVRKALHQRQEAITLQYIVSGDFESRQKLETGLDQAGTYIL